MRGPCLLAGAGLLPHPQASSGPGVLGVAAVEGLLGGGVSRARGLANMVASFSMASSGLPLVGCLASGSVGAGLRERQPSMPGCRPGGHDAAAVLAPDEAVLARRVLRWVLLRAWLAAEGEAAAQRLAT